jgi:hypothetical protein
MPLTRSFDRSTIVPMSGTANEPIRAVANGTVAAFGASHWRTGGVGVGASLLVQRGRRRRTGGLRVQLAGHIAIAAVACTPNVRANRVADRARRPATGERHDHGRVASAGE